MSKIWICCESRMTIQITCGTNYLWIPIQLVCGPREAIATLLSVVMKKKCHEHVYLKKLCKGYSNFVGQNNDAREPRLPQRLSSWCRHFVDRIDLPSGGYTLATALFLIYTYII